MCIRGIGLTVAGAILIAVVGCSGNRQSQGTGDDRHATTTSETAAPGREARVVLASDDPESRVKLSYSRGRQSDSARQVLGGNVPYRGASKTRLGSRLLPRTTVVSAARDFMKRTGAHVPDSDPLIQDTSAGNRKRFRVVFPNAGSVTVDARDGAVWTFGSQAPWATAGRPARFTTVEAATPYVKGLAQRIGLPNHAQLTSIQLKAPRPGPDGGTHHGEIFAVFEFTDRGLRVPGGLMTLSIDPQDGSLRFMTALWKRYVIETSIPKLTADRAKAIADRVAERMRMGREPAFHARTQPKSRPPELQYARYRKGIGRGATDDGKPVRVRLAWHCHYGADGVLVDAVTGEVLETYAGAKALAASAADSSP